MVGKWLFKAALILIIVFTGYKVITGLNKSEEDKIRDKINELKEVMNKDEDIGKAKLILKNQSFKKLLDNPVQVNISSYNTSRTFSPREAAAQLTKIQTQINEIKIKFYDLEISVDKDQAMVNTAVRATAVNGSQKTAESAAIQIKMIKDENNEWLFKSFQEIDVLRKTE